jgi:hypothetical protein
VVYQGSQANHAAPPNTQPESGSKSITNSPAVAGLLVSEPDQNTNTPSHTYPHPEREETVADEPPEV